MRRQDIIRNLFIALIGAGAIAFISTRFGLQGALLSLLAVIIVWFLFEVVVSGVRLRVVWPRERQSSEMDNYEAQLAALMGMPLNDAPLARARVAIMFAPFKLSAPERSVLVRWATFALSGNELVYDVQAVPGFEGAIWAVRCRVIGAAQPLDGVIESREAHRIVEAHRVMIARLLEERRPRG